jgi:serine/threonine-protein kinase
VLSALSYAHERGIVHRDIKPGNMMLTPGGVVKLMDFGIAKDTGGHQLTATGTTMGSLYYMSPEQIKGGPALDARADIYSVGISLYEMVTGKRPFDGDSQFAVMSAHLEKNPVPPINIDPTLPASLNDAILMAVEKDAEKRFQTAVAFRAALQTVVTTAPVRAAAAAAAPGIPQAATAAATPRVAAGGAVSAGPRSRRGLWMALGAVFTAAVVIGLVQFGPWRQTRAQEPATPQVVTQPKPSEPAPTVPAAPPAETAPTPAPAVAEPAPVKPAAAPVAKAKSSAPPVSKPAPVQQPVTSTPVPQQAQPVAAQPAPSTPPAAPQVALAPDAAARRAELQQLREELVQAGARAGAVRTTLQNMARSQAASGLGMRADITEAASLMNSYLEGANAALNAGDAASAKDFLEKAGRQLDRLEKFVGR